jgi:hypothetical protein
MYDAMLSMHKWSRAGLVVVPMFRHVPAHVASFLNDDAPPTILVVVSECEASSAMGLGAVVPAAETSKILISHVSVWEHQAVLRRFVDANAFAGQGSLVARGERLAHRCGRGLTRGWVCPCDIR